MKKRHQTSKRIISLFFLFSIFYFLFSNIYHSFFFQKRDRLNLVFYGENTSFFSLGLSDSVNYFIPYYPDLQITVPGGFGRYRIGALAKLVSLEKNPTIFKKAFSNASSVFVDFYFYPQKPMIYFGGLKAEEKDFFLPKFSQIFLYKTNANFFERIFVYLLFVNKRRNNFHKIMPFPIKKNVYENILDEKNFFNNVLGNFYEMTYRNERTNVQIIYSKNEKTAALLSRIIEGQGIRVADLTWQLLEGRCQLIENKKNKTNSVKRLSSFFGCPVVYGETGAYDIIFKLGKIENEWEID